MDSSKKTVLITGSTRGIGLAFAEQYTKAGWNVIGTARADSSTEKLKWSWHLRTKLQRHADHMNKSIKKMNSQPQHQRRLHREDRQRQRHIVLRRRADQHRAVQTSERPPSQLFECTRAA
ncbi:hypothetical protein PC118_g10734 [Phytophthora cactorum]|uniref:NAD(P)-binding domain n=1 Tax=Phytophthora cactorum TaxID=29920 RepID=A0A8T1FRJ9_9STRA|nr:hypothetical protein PC118_g10734 [Phytophthora cactorum]